MHIFNEIEPLKAFLGKIKSDAHTIGFVPTMGALHQGHLSLVKASQRENSITVCSIYVNPTQFNNAEDLAKYPRTIDNDISLLKEANCDVLFCPGNDVMYESDSQIRFGFGSLDSILEGRFRPGHFSGVALVVSKLFHIVNPCKAYFGQKDFQQYKIIEKLVEDLKFNLALRCIPIERESDGLAMSSRNARLSSSQRKKATIFYQSLTQGAQMLRNGISWKIIQSEIKATCESIEDIRLEYFELADTSNLNSLESVSNKAILLVAGYVGEVRLIDNLLLEA
jgi:pantoate--beta-alanine ligase